jgi:predicted acylesterase/phospholipase RssA
MRNVLYGEAVFDGSPLERLVKAVTPLEAVFAEKAAAVKIMAVDYLTGRQVVASNKDPRQRLNFHACILGSMALAPFLKCHLIYDVVDAGLLDEPWTRVGPYRDIAVLFDGGFSDNLMFDDACLDKCSVVFVVDINGLRLGPLTTHRWDHWANTLQRAFHVLVTTNDNRRISGVERTNEVLAIRSELAKLAAGRAVSKRTADRLNELAARMDEALELGDKHPVQTLIVDDPAGSRPFDFASFTHEESVHLLHSGHQAATRALQSVEIA